MPDLAAPLIAWYRENARDLPWRRPGFGAWGTLVSEFMLQQTPVARVIPHLEAWLHRWPTPTALAADPPAAAVAQWANLGYPRRALWLHRAAVEIRDRHAGVVPREVDDLLALTGIGDYTARAVAAFAYGDRNPVVDTNTRRVLARAVDGRSQPGPPSKGDLAAMAAILPADPAEAAIVNAAAMELGAVVCTARAARCARSAPSGSPSTRRSSASPPASASETPRSHRCSRPSRAPGSSPSTTSSRGSGHPDGAASGPWRWWTTRPAGTSSGGTWTRMPNARSSSPGWWAMPS